MNILGMDPVLVVAALVGLASLILAVRASTPKTRPAMTLGPVVAPLRNLFAEQRGFLLTLCAALRASEGAPAAARADPEPDVSDAIKECVARAAASSRRNGIGGEGRRSPRNASLRMSDEAFDANHKMIRDGNQLLEQGRAKEATKLFVAAVEAAERAAAADITDVRPQWLLGFAWFGLGNAAEQAGDVDAALVPYKRGFFRMVKAYDISERSLLTLRKQGKSRA